MKTGFVSIIGRPNVGKSTLLNAILGEKIAITTDKPQTTRNTIRGIYTHYADDMVKDDMQMVFIDTPGIHRPRTKLGKYMTDAAVGTFNEVEAIIFIVDDKLSAGPGDKYIVDMLDDITTPKVLVINKIDKLEPEAFEQIYKEYDELGIFEEIIGVSAKEGKNVQSVIKAVSEFMEEGPMFFPDDMVTEHPERFIVSEIIREKILMYLQDEVPHGVAVEIERYKEESEITRISAVIYCEKKSHKGMIIGNSAKTLKGIDQTAQEKHQSHQRNTDIALSNFGYKD